jgi:hypothetical protein
MRFSVPQNALFISEKLRAYIPGFRVVAVRTIQAALQPVTRLVSTPVCAASLQTFMNNPGWDLPDLIIQAQR